MHNSFDIFYYAGLFKRYWKQIAVIVAVSVGLVTVVTLRKAPVYSSNIKLLLSEGGSSSTVSSLGSILGVSGISGGGVSSKDIIIAVLESRRMRKDIVEKFRLGERPGFWWKTYITFVNTVLTIEVKGSDPDLVREIAVFSAENLNKLNEELDITSQKPMAKVLDFATPGSQESKDLSRKATVIALFSFLGSLFLFVAFDYLKRLKKTHGK